MPGLLRARAGWLSTDSAWGIPGDNEEPQLSDGGPVTSGQVIPGGQALTRLVMLVVVCSYLTVVVLEEVSARFSSRSLALGIGIPSAAVLLVLTLYITSPAVERWSLRLRLATLLVDGLVAYLPIIVLGTVGADVAGFFAGAALLLLSGWIAWAVFTTTIVGVLTGGMIGLFVAAKFPWSEASYLTIAALVQGLMLFGLARLSVLVRYVHARRGELVQLAVVSERMRFARDLHDLLGSSLSAITLKAELTRRLVGGNPARAADELAEVLDIARQALADVRTVSSGYRNISLAKEVRSVTALLGEAGVETQVAINCGELDERTDSMLATVLREAVANMLRHSTARHCAVEASTEGGEIRLRIANDGVPRSARPSRRGGGLENLSSRLADIGGGLTARVRADGWFEVLAQAPYPQGAQQPGSGTGPRKSGRA